MWIRVGPRKGIASEADERILMEKRRTNVTSFDSMPCLNATLDDLDTRLFNHFFLPKAVDDDVIKEDTRDIHYQLSAFGFYDTRYDCSTNAGILFFAKNLRRFIGGAYIQYVKFAGKDRASDILSEHEFKDNLCTILPEIDTFIKTAITNRRPIPVSSARKENVVDYPDWATRELVMNAICHRDYRGVHTQMKVYDNHIRLWNEGGLIDGMTTESLRKEYNSRPRNQLIAQVFFLAGFIEAWGRGIWRVDQAFVEVGLQLPSFEENCGGITVVIPRAKNVAPQATPQATTQATPQPTPQVKMLIFTLKQQRLTVMEIMEVLNLKSRKNFMTNYLRPAIDAGWVAQLYPDKPKHPEQRYYLTEAGLQILMNEPDK